MESDLIDSKFLDLIVLSTDLTAEENDEDEADNKVHNHNIVEKVVTGPMNLSYIVGVVIALIDKGDQFLCLVSIVLSRVELKSN
jgi:hypothetical protein